MRCLLATLLFTKFLERIPVGTFHKLYPPKTTFTRQKKHLEEEELFLLLTNITNKLRVTLAMRRAKHVTEAVLCCVILLVIQRSSESIRVIGGSRTVVQGEDVDLSCRLLETDEELEQITWQKRTLEEPENHNFLLIYPSGVTDFISSNGLEIESSFLEPGRKHWFYSNNCCQTVG
ncbi:unnamed protein product [Oncorhynchus mykiss]|uniref:Immunoglobulin V-set domain-containing protein n=1 Tax=Oncorhynchus mykiss TaxID=8022 RepID=A0A060WNW2_ONCMY|nr:unnamed protein product [Oncorhynchus mykiss]